MRNEMFYLGAALFLVTTSVGCASDGSGAPAEKCALAAPLTCGAMFLCSNSTVKVFHGDLPAPAGGSIAVGSYRLGYALYPTGQGGDSAVPADQFVFGSGDFLHVGMDDAKPLPHFVQDVLGTYTTSASSLTLSVTTACSNDGPPSLNTCTETTSEPLAGVIEPYSATFDYTTNADTLSLFYSTPGFPAMYVYYLMTGAEGPVRDACTSVAGSPQAPGDSLQCTPSGLDECVCHETGSIAIDCSSN